MELYIDIDFLDNYFKESEASPTKIQKIIRSFFSQYKEVIIYINRSFTKDDFSDKKICNNPILAEVYSNGLARIVSISDPISDYLFKNSNFEQTLVFMNDDQSWFEIARKKGALCFSNDNYEEKIKNIVTNLHFDIDLSEGFKGWSFIDGMSDIPMNKLTIEDSYILSEKNQKYMKGNIVELLNMFIINRTNKIQIKFLTKELDSISSHPEHIKEKASKRIKYLNKMFANYNLKFQVIMNNLGSVNYHDRFIRSNFQLLKSGVGFNPSRHKTSNSEIISKTIFDKPTYKKLKSLHNMESLYMDELNKKDKSFFKMYP